MGLFAILKTGTGDIFPEGCGDGYIGPQFQRTAQCCGRLKWQRKVSLSLPLSFIVQSESHDDELKDARCWQEGCPRPQGQGQWSCGKKTEGLNEVPPG